MPTAAHVRPLYKGMVVGMYILPVQCRPEPSCDAPEWTPAGLSCLPMNRVPSIPVVVEVGACHQQHHSYDDPQAFTSGVSDSKSFENHNVSP